jgi:uncharacterized protein YjbI with pentapeptide repeats
VNSAEKWVVAQAAAGEMADLRKKFPEEKDRKLSAHFLEQLLTGSLPGFKLHRMGVRIIGAMIDEPIDLTNAQILCDVQLQRCRFMRNANLIRASFAGVVLLNGSTFGAGVNFSSMKVAGGAHFWGAVFEGPVNFGWANITGNFEANGAKFQNKEKVADFDSMKVGHAAFFDNVVFEGPVSFVGADSAYFLARAAKFLNKEKVADFNNMKVGGFASFQDAVFEGPVNFDYASFALLDLSKVAGHFHMREMSYKYIKAAPEEPESHKELLKLADESAYTADAYSNLEAFFLRQGYRGDADRAFIAGKRRERRENLQGLGWLGSCLLDWLLRSNIGQVIKTIVDDEAFPDYAMPKKPAGRKKHPKTQGALGGIDTESEARSGTQPTRYRNTGADCGELPGPSTLC